MARNGRSGKDGTGGKDSRTGSPEAHTGSAARRQREFPLNRRDFLKITGAGSSALGLGAAGCQFIPIFVTDFSATLTRREDLVSLKFDFVNLKLQKNHDGSQQI